MFSHAKAGLEGRSVCAKVTTLSMIAILCAVGMREPVEEEQEEG